MELSRKVLEKGNGNHVSSFQFKIPNGLPPEVPVNRNLIWEEQQESDRTLYCEMKGNFKKYHLKKPTMLRKIFSRTGERGFKKVIRFLTVVLVSFTHDFGFS